MYIIESKFLLEGICSDREFIMLPILILFFNSKKSAKYNPCVYIVDDTSMFFWCSGIDQVPMWIKRLSYWFCLHCFSLLVVMELVAAVYTKMNI